MSQNYTIDLEKFRAIDAETGFKAKVFTGRDIGKKVRKESRLDEIGQNFDKITLIIPSDVYSINPSFFEELFINLILRLGKEKFLEKINFKTSGDFNWDKPLQEAINRILRNKNALEC